MLSQDVRVLRRPDIFVGSLELSRGRVSQDTAEESVPEADIRRYQRGEGG